ncbi:uncharacterized protein K452DRAFT_35489 [Aplosporella prunicola CBS 121167]|uniref:Uncharacterized protein n=1 Tax=Aplosporella prunicola CBS 121167 TaxID=1176127 RepID=A0A6A6ATG0_9PEZI|nr:uncharacterized protein K452DRAFT_35489 [Aplosporella prunicola CBS 121167]KAF2135292.1 hypothetical protein K452DRAFT_35489 [Aplosporella prunicola CBS 121167]
MCLRRRPRGRRGLFLATVILIFWPRAGAGPARSPRSRLLALGRIAGSSSSRSAGTASEMSALWRPVCINNLLAGFLLACLFSFDHSRLSVLCLPSYMRVVLVFTVTLLLFLIIVLSLIVIVVVIFASSIPATSTSIFPPTTRISTYSSFWYPSPYVTMYSWVTTSIATTSQPPLLPYCTTSRSSHLALLSCQTLVSAQHSTESLHPVSVSANPCPHSAPCLPGKVPRSDAVRWRSAPRQQQRHACCVLAGRKTSADNADMRICGCGCGCGCGFGACAAGDVVVWLGWASG